MTIREILRDAVPVLEHSGVPNAKYDAQAILAHALGEARLLMLADAGREVPPEASAVFTELLRRRAGREPLQYVVGAASFMGYDFAVEPGVLIPRADTETLAELAIRLSPAQGHALDLCCGTGCVGIALRLAKPELSVYAGDISPRCAALTRKNAESLGASIDVRQGDLFAPFAELRFDIIACNPPYIPTGELETLQEEVQQEPAIALNGGAQGLDFYRRIFTEVSLYLNPGGWLLLEMGDGQAEAVASLVPNEFSSVKTHPDLSGKTRVISAQKVTDGR